MMSRKQAPSQSQFFGGQGKETFGGGLLMLLVVVQYNVC